MKLRTTFLTLTLALSAFGFSADEYLGLYMLGQKIGYSSYSSTDDTYEGAPAVRTDSYSLMAASLLGAELKVETNTKTWKDKKGKMLRMTMNINSAGRNQLVDAKFVGNEARIDVDNSGEKSKKTLPVPDGALITDDPLTPFLADGMKPGATKTIYILDPTTVSFVKNEIKVKGPGSTTVNGKQVSGTVIEIVDPRMTVTVYVTSKGDLIKVDGPLGIEMLPESKEVAMGKRSEEKIDLAESSVIRPDKPIPNPSTLSRLVLSVRGADLSRVPSGDNQVATKTDYGWKVDVNPVKLSQTKGGSIAEARKEKPDWVKPDTYIPSNSPAFKELSKSIVNQRTGARDAAFAIQRYVHAQMKPNAGIGVLRDATEVLKTKEGVCRDYAILTATLMRAAGIPARLASGIVSPDGTFYYHAWVEIWDGGQWIGIDSTLPAQQLSAVHVKLAQGTVEDAFTFTFLDKVKIGILDTK